MRVWTRFICFYTRLRRIISKPSITHTRLTIFKHTRRFSPRTYHRDPITQRQPHHPCPPPICLFNHENTSRCQALEFSHPSTQCPSSSNVMNLASTPCALSALYAARPSVTGHRQSRCPWMTSVGGARCQFARRSGRDGSHFASWSEAGGDQGRGGPEKWGGVSRMSPVSIMFGREVTPSCQMAQRNCECQCP